MIRHFIHKSDDIYTSMINNRIIVDNCKPKPYKEYRELTKTEKTIESSRIHFSILLHNEENYKNLVDQSIINSICNLLPEISLKHNLKFDDSHEYWRNKKS